MLVRLARALRYLDRKRLRASAPSSDCPNGGRRGASASSRQHASDQQRASSQQRTSRRTTASSAFRGSTVSSVSGANSTGNRSARRARKQRCAAAPRRISRRSLGAGA